MMPQHILTNFVKVPSIMLIDEILIESRPISANLLLWLLHAFGAINSLCSESVFEGESRGRGAQEGGTYSQRTQLEAQHQGHRGTPASPTLFWICEGAGGGRRERQQHKMG